MKAFVIALGLLVSVGAAQAMLCPADCIDIPDEGTIIEGATTCGAGNHSSPHHWPGAKKGEEVCYRWRVPRAGDYAVTLCAEGSSSVEVYVVQNGGPEFPACNQGPLGAARPNVSSCAMATYTGFPDAGVADIEVAIIVDSPYGFCVPSYTLAVIPPAP